MAGALCGAVVVALVEANRAASATQVPFEPVALGDLGVIVPIATAVGLAVAAGGMLLDPRRLWSARGAIAGLADMEAASRARVAAAVLLAPLATLAW